MRQLAMLRIWARRAKVKIDLIKKKEIIEIVEIIEKKKKKEEILTMNEARKLFTQIIKQCNQFENI
jgi:hypothetical protein